VGRFRRLHLDDDEVGHDQIGPKTLLEHERVVVDRDRHLSRDAKATLADLVGENGDVDRLE
jgi:hypothetical protein